MATINVALYVFIALNPYLKWILPNEVFYSFFLFTTFTLSFLLFTKVKHGIYIDRSKKMIVGYILVYIIYFTLPLFHEMRWGHFFWFMPFLIILFYNDIIVKDSYRILKKIIVFVTVFSLLFWIINIFKFPIPYYSFYPDFRVNESDYYRIYGPAISLYNGNLPVGGLFGIERITGVFAEPGHFGIYLGIILAIEKFDITTRENQIILITGILTFSTAFYAIVLLGVAYRFYIDKKISKSFINALAIIFIVIGFGFYFSGEGFKQLVYGRVLDADNSEVSDVTDIVENRVSDKFIDEFNEFAKTPNVVYGLGYNELQTIPSTNWRGLIYRFGVVGFAIMLLLIYSILRRVDIGTGLLFFSIAILVISHRSYLFYTPTLYLLFFIATSIFKVKDNGYNFSRSTSIIK